MPQHESAKDKILRYLEENSSVTINDAYKDLGNSRQLMHRYLASLVKEGRVSKTGRPPKVYYYLSDKNPENVTEVKIPAPIKRYIDKHYFMITPLGEIKPGSEGFIEWCRTRNLPVEKTALEYKKTLDKYLAHNKGGFINGMSKMKSTFDNVYVDAIYYLDFYSIERFGKTKLGTKLLYAKQSQNARLIREMSDEINPKINMLIEKEKADAIGFIPPTVKRETQIMKELQRNLNTNLPVIKIIKIKSDVAVPQKTLNKLADRIENAKMTIMIDDKRSFNKVLLIDDAVGSGATINETAKSIKQKGVAQKVIGLAITGSYKGFDVISEV
ncbi:hypothetical protein A2982_03005 [candidate division WWE3 bacterium RIFCSPLOWO2_01_FULL_39_13]|uniref:Helix-turn-helix type 11 domain-containing protein n=1 Tax=candidate division WWE3 bacterium RIFCSPLOWO2_01_FULL_39_13 TaxID=1802624 RepID=A0A1F4V235_UNCKA|nr:MAG: hypothetical protein A2982_03005 [candidate division WWE3 bacterium RIFCSPLOWO2_01_FULL_39_13]